MADEPANRVGAAPHSRASDLATGRPPVEWEIYMREVLDRLAQVELSGGGGGGASLLHTQSTPEDTWTIEHDFNGYPLVNVIAPDGHQVFAEVTYPDLDTVVILFSEPQTGFAYLRG